ncbi:MAG: hypothetical protein QXY70_03645, partial [Nanopusillaceae archaeon]
PTIQHNLLDFVRDVKKIGLKVKIDTNGLNPGMIEKILPFIDYVALDLKTIFDNYKNLGCKIPNPYQLWKETLNLILKSKKSFEIRTTLVKPIILPHHFKELKNIVKDYPYFLQNYRKIDNNNLEEFNENEIEIVKTILKRNIIVR